jgi:hypothetical protein
MRLLQVCAVRRRLLFIRPGSTGFEPARGSGLGGGP